MSEEEKVPRLTVDIIIEIHPGTVVLFERKNPPPGWALPGGFVDYGESLEEAAVREAEEETRETRKVFTVFHSGQNDGVGEDCGELKVGDFWCLGPELNQRRRDFQSLALPTELPRQ